MAARPFPVRALAGAPPLCDPHLALGGRAGRRQALTSPSVQVPEGRLGCWGHPGAKARSAEVDPSVLSLPCLSHPEAVARAGGVAGEAGAGGEVFPLGSICIPTAMTVHTAASQPPWPFGERLE